MRAPRTIAAVAAALTALAASATATAEPHFAQREGFKCSQCHVNRTGGGKRTRFGHQWALTHLDAFASAPPASASAGRAHSVTSTLGALDPNLNAWVSVGADLRLANTTVFAKEIHTGFETPEASVYLQVDPTRYLTLYADTSLAGGSLESREAFLLVEPARGMSLKAGYMLLPYGLRIWGDDELIRKQTGYTMANPDLGIELGFERRRFGAFLAVSNGAGGGQDADEYKRFSARVEHVWRAARFGLSGAYNRSKQRATFLTGPFAGVTLGRLSLLGELDLSASRHFGPSANGYSLLGYVEANLLARRGLNLKASYGWEDPDLAQREDTRSRLRAGVELSPMPFLITALYGEAGLSVPQDEVGNAKRLLAEVHLYF